MAINKLVNAKEAALKDLELELKAIEELSSKVTDQCNRLEIERLNMVVANRPNTSYSADSNNQTTHDPNTIHQVSSEIVIPVDLESQQINITNLNLSVAAALELRNNSSYEDSSENEDLT